MHFLIYFKKSDKITLNLLKSTITGIMNYYVHFEHYKPRVFGPTLCRNCQEYGHSSSNCNLQPRCMRCSENHKSTECPHIDKTTNKIPEDKVKCANCQGQHTSNYSNCKYRLDLMKKNQTRAELSRKNQNKGYVITNQNYSTSFPRLPRAPSSFSQPNTP